MASKIKKALKKIGKAALVAGAGYAAMKGLGRRKQNKAFLATEGGDKSDMRDYGPFTKRRTPITTKIPDNRSQSVLGQGIGKNNQVDYSGISDRIEDAAAAKGGRIVKTKGGGKAVRGLGRAFTKGKR